MSGYTLNTLEGLENIDVSQVTNTRLMFSNTSINGGLDLTSWDVSNWTVIGGFAFSGITADYVDLSGWDTSNLKEIGGSAFGMIRVEYVDLRGWDLTITNMGSMAFFDNGTTGTVYYVSNEATKEIVEANGANAIIMK